MTVTILCVGKRKEKYFRDAVDEYAKRLSKYCKFSVIEVADEECKESASAAEEELVKTKEGERLLAKIPQGAYVYALAIKGKKIDSVAFSGKINQLMVSGKSQIYFIIGGSLGLSPAVLNRADEQISFSDMTFPHQLMRVILAEQIYRAFRIMNREPYHK